MKMQKKTPTCPMWMEDSFLYDDTDGEEDYDHRFGTVDSVSAYTPGETDTEICGPYSVTSCPPSVGPDQDAFLPTPHNIYAPASPGCITSQNFPDSGHNHPTDDFQHVLSANKMDKMYDRVTRLQADPHQTNVGSGCIISGREDTQKAGFARLDNDVSRSVPELNPRCEGFLQDVSRGTRSSSFHELENVHSKEPVHTEPLEVRRISFDEFIAIVPEEQLFQTLHDESHMSPRGNGHTQIIEDSNTFMNDSATSRNVKTPEQSKTTNRARKRTANRLIFSNSDFSSLDNEIPVKRQMVVPSQTHLMKHFKDEQMYNDGSIVDEMCNRAGLAPDVRNIDSKKERSTSACRNPVYRFPASLTATLQQDTGQFDQAVQDPQTSSLAATTPTTPTTPTTTTTPTIFNLDNNGNLVATDNHTDSHINHWDVDTKSNHNQHEACTACNETTSLQIEQHVTSSIMPTLPDNTIASVSLEEAILQILYNTAASCERPPDIGACNREETSSATTTTSNDIRQPQEMDRNSHLFNPSASTYLFPAGTDLLPDAADPLIEDSNNSGICCLPVDAITAQMFTKNNTDSTSLYRTQTFSDTKSALQNNDIIDTHVSNASDDVVESLPGNSRFSIPSTRVYGYHDNDIHENPQGRTNTDQGIFFWESSTPDELIHERSGVVESEHVWNFHATATDRINGIPSQTMYDTHAVITSADLAANTVSALTGYHFTPPSPRGSIYANGDTDYLIETNLEHLPASGSSADDSHFSATNPQNRVFDVFLDAASQDSDTAFACDHGRNILTDAAGSVADSGSTTVDPSGVTDSALALRKSAETAQTSDFVKQELKYAILTKRQKEGKTDLDISFRPGGPHELTEEEQEKELRRKELNRKAAANHRKKNKTSKETLAKEYENLVKKRSQLKETVAQMESEKKQLLNCLQDLGIPYLGILNVYTRM